MSEPVVVEPIVVRLTNIGGVLGLHDQAEDFDYACSRARADAVDRLLLHVIDERGWTLFDDEVVERVSVQHDGKQRARILVDGLPVTQWWEDRLAAHGEDLSWHFEPTP